MFKRSSEQLGDQTFSPSSSNRTKLSKILDMPKMDSRTAAGILNISTARAEEVSVRYNQLGSHHRSLRHSEARRRQSTEIREVARRLPKSAYHRGPHGLPAQKVPCLITATHQLPANKKKSFAAFSQATGRRAEKISHLCVLCQSGDHRFRQCDKLLKLSVQERIQCAKAKKLCLNCLGDHSDRCSSRYTWCNEKHHSLLHLE